MHYGHPIVVSAVGGLVEAVDRYEGAILVEPGDPEALAGAIQQARGRIGRRFHNPHGWSETAELYRRLFAGLEQETGAPARQDAPAEPAEAEVA
jgi:glycosyltransferase involved in cell wall biosynthesis